MSRREYLKESWTNQKVEEKESPLHGRGLFAKRPISAGEVVIVRGGQFVDKTAAETAKREGKAVQQIDKNLHSCDPNTWMGDEVTITARRDIQPSEELLIDYATFLIDDEWVMPGQCACSSSLCRHRITGFDWRRPDLQERYRGHFSPFINKRIETGVSAS